MGLIKENSSWVSQNITFMKPFYKMHVNALFVKTKVFASCSTLVEGGIVFVSELEMCLLILG